MVYIEKIKSARPIMELGGRVNNVRLYDLGGEKVVLLERKIKSEHPKDIASVPRILEVPSSRLRWMSYREQEKHSKDLSKIGLNVVQFLEIGEDYAIRDYVEGLPLLSEQLDAGDISSVGHATGGSH